MGHSTFLLWAAAFRGSGNEQNFRAFLRLRITQGGEGLQPGHCMCRLSVLVSLFSSMQLYMLLSFGTVCEHLCSFAPSAGLLLVLEGCCQQ